MSTHGPGSPDDSFVPPPTPPPYPPHHEQPAPKPSFWLSTLAGFLLAGAVLAVAAIGTFTRYFRSGLDAMSTLAGWMFVAAIVMIFFPKTRRLAFGMIGAMGIGLIALTGVCVVALTRTQH